MRKALVLVLFLAGSSIVSLAQEINGGVEISFPSGVTLFGVTARYEKSFANNFKWMVTPSFQFGGGGSFITLQGGAKYQFDQAPLYIGAELGPAFISYGNNSETRFGFTPSFGYRVDETWDLSMQVFTGVGTTFVGLRFAYAFSKR